MNKYYRIFLVVIGLLIGGFLAYYFFNILIYLFIAAAISFIGQPLVRLFDKIRIKNIQFPHTLSAILSLLLIMGIASLFILLFVPIIFNQAASVANIDFNAINHSLDVPLANLESKIIGLGLLQEGESLRNIILSEVEGLFGSINFQGIINKAVSISGNLFIAVFAVLFLSFFFLRDERLLYNGIMLLTPNQYMPHMRNILKDSKRLLSRYFIGVCLELIIMMTLITIGNKIIGTPNAFLIGSVGGFMNIIPYVGPIIGTFIGVTIGISSNLDADFYTQMLPSILGIFGVFVASNLIDNIILQPMIYSTSVMAHPIEIFLVIIMAGSLAGITGMILAIPAYTVIRIVARQFFSQSKIVQGLTKYI